MPMTAHSVKIIGSTGNWMYCPLLDLAYLEKSGMLHASVDQVPVTEDMHERKR